MGTYRERFVQIKVSTGARRGAPVVHLFRDAAEVLSSAPAKEVSKSLWGSAGLRAQRHLLRCWPNTPTENVGTQGPQWTTSQWDDVAFGTRKCQRRRRVRHSGVQWFLRGVRGVRVDPASQNDLVLSNVTWSQAAAMAGLMQARLREVPEASVTTDQTLFVRISTVPNAILEASSCKNKGRSTTWTWLCGARTQRRRHQPRERFLNSWHAS